TLEEVAARREAAGNAQEAARVERRRAELLRDARHDLDAAELSLERSDRLSPELETAQLGASLSELRQDRTAQAKWLERAVERTQGPARARLLLALARVLSTDGQWPDRADAAAREALLLDPSLAEAERLLLERLEGLSRLPELAGYYEDAAARAGKP